MIFKLLKEYRYPITDFEEFTDFVYSVQNSMNCFGYVLDRHPSRGIIRMLYRLYIKSQELHQYQLSRTRILTNAYKPLEPVFFDASGYEQRMHILWDLVKYYKRIKDVLEMIYPSIAVDYINDDTKEGRKENWERSKRAVDILMEKNHIENRPQGWSMHENILTINRIEEIVNLCDLKPENTDKLRRYILLTIRYARQYIVFVDKMVMIYKLDISSIEKFIKNDTQDEDVRDQGLSEKYVTLRPTYRRAAAEMLINKTGLCRNIDRTRIAYVVEAIAGGNIETRPQDTVAYKKPTKEAKAAAAELLKKIGIE